jgi:hypothetical protein
MTQQTYGPKFEVECDTCDFHGSIVSTSPTKHVTRAEFEELLVTAGCPECWGALVEPSE